MCAKVGGLRYSTLTEAEEQALAFDESVASDDDLSYDEWEAIRFLKLIAVLKLLRRPLPVYTVIPNRR